jgi:hypothetical protein
MPKADKIDITDDAALAEPMALLRTSTELRAAISPPEGA